MARLVVLIGDSIGAMYGIPQGAGFVDRAARYLAQHGVSLENWSTGGALAAGYVDMLPQLTQRLKLKARSSAELLVVIELGGNDRLCGLPPEKIERALEQLVQAAKEVPARAMLMEVIPDGIEQDVARRCGVSLVATPACLAGQMQKPLQRGVVPPLTARYQQPDGIHPNARAQRHIAASLLEALCTELRLPMPAPLGEGSDAEQESGSCKVL
mmetsp:Transcript_27971/g.65261  ORF Transcript_27971/g.65261 Transcript_27971/m.65261 type:complete len:213 (+) Transcript_27971:33-671(+)